MSTSLLAVSSMGAFGSGVSPTCDYPSENNVRDGVIYADGSMVGNITLPQEDDVLLDIGYGSNGTELVGTLSVPQPPTPVPPVQGMTPFAAIGTAIIQRLALLTGLDQSYVVPVASDKYAVTIEEPFFLYCQFFKVQEPRDPALRYTDSGAGRRSTSVGRRLRVYIYTRVGSDVYGTDFIALFGFDPSQVSTTGQPPGQFIAEEIVYNALNNWTPLSGDLIPQPLTLTPLHPIESSEEPERKPDNEEGLVRSCLDWEIVYNLCIDPSEPPN